VCTDHEIDGLVELLHLLARDMRRRRGRQDLHEGPVLVDGGRGGGRRGHLDVHIAVKFAPQVQRQWGDADGRGRVGWRGTRLGGRQGVAVSPISLSFTAATTPKNTPFSIAMKVSHADV